MDLDSVACGLKRALNTGKNKKKTTNNKTQSLDTPVRNVACTMLVASSRVCLRNGKNAAVVVATVKQWRTEEGEDQMNIVPVFRVYLHGLYLWVRKIALRYNA